MNKSLTIVLPVHNAESHLRKNVIELLELASDLTSRFAVLVIDDGSTDATSEVAEELAAHYPQVTVRRQRMRRGLSATIDYVERRVRSDAVIVHDGVTPIDLQQMRREWQTWVDRLATREKAALAAPAAPRDNMQDLADFPAIQAAMERAHGRALGFQAIAPGRAFAALPDVASPVEPDTARTDAAHFPGRAGVGRIPSLPRPKFLSALAEFALGE